MLKPILLAALLTATAAATTVSAQTMSAPATTPTARAHLHRRRPATTSPTTSTSAPAKPSPHLKLHYLTLGTPHRDASGHVDNAVLLLHGTGGDAHSLFNPVFSNVLFGPGQPLDIHKYFLIFPDDIGHGESSKPSDGLRMKFPQYDYDDMVRSQHQMLLDGLHVDHLRLILGTSMGCMQSFVWGETYPEFADALMPLACLPVQLAGRNRMMRYMAIENIERDPGLERRQLHHRARSKASAPPTRCCSSWAPRRWSCRPTSPPANKPRAYVDKYLARTVAATDANNFIYYVNASRNYDPSPHLDRIKVPVMWINSADDFINPPELGIAEKMVHQMPNAQFVLIPISDKTRGHGTHTMAAIWQNYLVQLLNESAPKH